MDGQSVTVVVADTSVLINFIHVERLDLFGALESFTFVIPDQVAEEVTRSEQRQLLDDAVGSGYVRQESSTDAAEIARYAEFRQILGRGEAASLAMAEVRGWSLACDERGRFLREARQHLGERRLTNTPGLMLLAIRSGHLSIHDADGLKLRLEQHHRFRMAFSSFRDLT